MLTSSLSRSSPPDGTQLLRQFIENRWGDAAPRTRKKVRAVLMSFFRWANGEFKLRGNPVEAIKAPKLRDVERELFTEAHADLLVASQESQSHRVALQLLFGLALRKNELRLIQFKHFDLGRRRLTVFGKGGTIISVPIPTEELRLEIERLILERRPKPNEFLLYPTRRGKAAARAQAHHGRCPGGASLGRPAEAARRKRRPTVVEAMRRERRRPVPEHARGTSHSYHGFPALQREPEADATAGPSQRHLDHGEHLRPPGRHGS
jgi:integrase